MKKTALVLLTFLSFTVYSQTYRDTLNLKLSRFVENSDLKGVGVAIVMKDTILFKGGFGYSDIENKTLYTTKTIQNIGSISKTFIAFALMNLVENHKINLDDPINNYLTFKVVNPNYPNIPITIRQLATHTSSLTDGRKDMTIEKTYLFKESIDFSKKELPKGYCKYFKIYKKNKKMAMNEFVRNVYSENGSLYSKHNFLNKKPATTYQYTNIGATLLAYIIELVAEKPFDKFTKEILFDKLQLKNTTWNFDKVSKENLTSLYLSNGLKIPHYSLITYPDGGLFTNINDFSLYLQEMIRGINGDSFLLKQTSYKIMMSNQLTSENFPNGNFDNSKGILWTVNKDEDNISSNGSDPGIATYTLFTTQGNIGIVMFTNSNFDENKRLKDDFMKIRSILFQSIKKLLN